MTQIEKKGGESERVLVDARELTNMGECSKRVIMSG